MNLTSKFGVSFKFFSANIWRHVASQSAKLSTNPVSKTGGGTTSRYQIAKDIAKHFNNVSLVDFPLLKPATLTELPAIEEAHINCHFERLDENPNYYPSISTILNETMSPESLSILKRWEAEKIKELGLDGFQKYRKSLFSRGKILHNNIRTYLESRDTTKLQFDSTHQENFWKSIEHIMPKINNLYASEFPVYHPVLKYRGILDCVASYHDIPTIFEWKTSEKAKPTIAHTYDNPLQAIAYFSCLQYDQLGAFIPDVKEVILVIAYEDGSKAHVHTLERSFRVEIWKKFLKRLEQYWSQLAN